MSVCETNPLKANSTMNFETKSKLNVFENYYSTLADNPLKKLQTPQNKNSFNSAIQF